MYMIAVNYILGIRIIDDRLYIRPNLPKGFNNYTFTYKHKNANYLVSVNLNEDKNEILLDGYLEDVNYITLRNDSKTHNVVVNIKEK